MASGKYNERAALDLIADAYKSGRNITYKEMEDALGLEYPLDDKAHTSMNNNTIYRLREKCKKEHGLVFHSASKGKNDPTLQYYTVTKVKDTETHKKPKKVEPVKTVAQPDRSALEALSKDNQKLYQEVEELRLQNRRLLDMVSEANSNIEEYKTIIKSLMILAGMDL